VFADALTAATLPHCRPYDLRHSFASLLLHEGRSVIEFAAQLGHGANLTLSTYGHCIAQLDGKNVSAEEAIRAARAADVRVTFAK
jgi:integrase